MLSSEPYRPITQIHSPYHCSLSNIHAMLFWSIGCCLTFKREKKLVRNYVHLLTNWSLICFFSVPQGFLGLADLGLSGICFLFFVFSADGVHRLPSNFYGVQLPHLLFQGRDLNKMISKDQRKCRTRRVRQKLHLTALWQKLLSYNCNGVQLNSLAIYCVY